MSRNCLKVDSSDRPASHTAIMCVCKLAFSGLEFRYPSPPKALLTSRVLGGATHISANYFMSQPAYFCRRAVSKPPTVWLLSLEDTGLTGHPKGSPPTESWFTNKGAEVSVVTRKTTPPRGIAHLIKACLQRRAMSPSEGD